MQTPFSRDEPLHRGLNFILHSKSEFQRRAPVLFWPVSNPGQEEYTKTGLREVLAGSALRLLMSPVQVGTQTQKLVNGKIPCRAHCSSQLWPSDGLDHVVSRKQVKWKLASWEDHRFLGRSGLLSSVLMYPLQRRRK